MLEGFLKALGYETVTITFDTTAPDTPPTRRRRRVKLMATQLRQSFTSRSTRSSSS